MAIYNGDNYQGQFVDKPSSKFPKGEQAGRKRLLKEKRLSDIAFQVGDRILGPKIPASSLITDAKVRISKSLGATGIFDLGYLANGVDAEDTDAFVVGADGGQGVAGPGRLERASHTSAGIYKRFTKETQLVLICTEVCDGTVLDADIEWEVEYVND